MTVNHIISLVDLKEPNNYTPKEKISWLSAIDGKIHDEVITKYEGYDPEADEYTMPAAGDDELLIDAPWGEDIYVHYLIARIAQDNGETMRYNQHIALYNAAYSQWWNHWNSTHRPAGRPRFRF